MADLTELELSDVKLDLAALTKASIQQILKIQVLGLIAVEFENGTPTELCQFVASTFPNLKKLNISLAIKVRKK